ncbi:MAG TPA: tagatose-6-phosphate ketose isomerase, partial [Blastocatellia bacterium]|nr:tagatose-6-phosphate ketose isomerase [Blastocatellia bacterium]
MEVLTGTDALTNLLALPEREKEGRGLLYTPREIYQQPETWQTTYQLIARRQPEIREFLQEAGIGATGRPQPTVLLVGAGTSDYIGRSLTALLRAKWRCEVIAVPSTDLLTGVEEWLLPDRPYFWISFSRSGDSPEGVAVLDMALRRYPEIRHLVLTCNQESRMARQFSGHPRVRCLVLDDAVNDRGLAMTSSYSNMVIAGHCLAHIQALAEYEAILEQLCGAGKRFLGPAADLAERLAAAGFSRLCLLGAGPLNAVARESALKVLELTAGRVCTLPESSLGLRHGPLSAVDQETLVVSYLSGDERRRGYDLDLLEEIRRKGLGKTRVAVSANADARAERLVDLILSSGLSPSFPDVYRPPVDVIFGQSLGLFASLYNGLKPDTPSPNGA